MKKKFRYTGTILKWNTTLIDFLVSIGYELRRQDNVHQSFLFIDKGLVEAVSSYAPHKGFIIYDTEPELTKALLSQTDDDEIYEGEYLYRLGAVPPNICLFDESMIGEKISDYSIYSKASDAQICEYFRKRTRISEYKNMIAKHPDEIILTHPDGFMSPFKPSIKKVSDMDMFDHLYSNAPAIPDWFEANVEARPKQPQNLKVFLNEQEWREYETECDDDNNWTPEKEIPQELKDKVKNQCDLVNKWYDDDAAWVKKSKIERFFQWREHYAQESIKRLTTATINVAWKQGSAPVISTQRKSARMNPSA